MDTKTKRQINKILNKVTNGRITELDYNKDLKSQLCLDSIQIVELFAELEKTFEIELPLKMMTVNTGNEFMALLDEQLSFKQAS